MVKFFWGASSNGSFSLRPPSVVSSKEGFCRMPVLTAKDVQIRAQSALAASPVYALRDLRVEQQGDALLIRGLVSSFYHKQLAQEVVRQAAEGVEVVNSIHVR
jgi:hypothetical protein